MNRRPLSPVDICSHDVYEQAIPHEAFARLRRDTPVAWHPEPGGNAGFWAVTRWADLVAVHRDHETFSSQIGGTELEELERDPEAREARRTMLETDPPEHTRLRRMVSRNFTRRSIDRWTGDARRIMARVLDDALGGAGANGAGAEVEFVGAVARRLPILMISRILGVPDGDTGSLFEWADRIIYHADPDYSEVVFDKEDTDPYRLLPFRSPTSTRVFAYAQRLADGKRRHPADDVVSLLVAADELSPQNFNTLFLLLVIAGNETTRHALNHGALALAERPDELARLRADPDLLTAAVEEVLRYASPQIHFRRTAMADTKIAGVPVAAGDKVVTWYLSANYDGEVFADPYTLDLGRDPNRHVTFGGGGPHFCLGSWLARLEVRVFLEEVLARNLRLEVCGEVTRVRSNFINGLKRLPLRLAAG
ncbi:MAG: cytochrome P450 [Acidimicrobiia bacterium]|nr:cytochrome P450 [Acidimicrobiia bacterium]MYC45114.1 cytochrome P450 [Acidimicrobiia bacterium]MYI19359.1 cytochrome P450 [Acidimicrobiia bacterium]